MKKTHFLAVCLFFPYYFQTATAQTKTPVCPQWIFSHWIWENEGTTQSALQMANDYLQHNIPVGAIIIDSPWETGYNTFDFDTALYPNAQQMIDSFHSKNIKVFLWITSMLNTDVPLYSYADSMGYFMCANSTSGSSVINWWKGDGSLIDFFNPDAVLWWKALMDKALSMGIDGWKCDGADFYAGGAPYSPYLQTTVTRNDYSEKYYRLFHDYTRSQLGNERVITARPIDNYGYDIGGSFVAFAPLDITWCGWVGDQDATFDGLEKALNNMYYSAEYNYLSFGSDIGGFRTDDNYPVTGRAKNLFIRWAQMGAFCPIMENGGGGEHRPWMFDSETNDIYKKFALLHTQLIPYLFEQSDTAFQQSKSMLAFFNKTDYSYLLGSDIFIAPVLDSTSTVNISFPAGDNWVYLFDTTQTFAGGQTAQLNFSLDEFPVFLKQNSPLINTLLPVLSAEKEFMNEDAGFRIYPNPSSGKFTIRTMNNEQGIMNNEVTIYNVLGEKIYSEKILNLNSLILNLDFPSGIYFLQLKTEKGISNKKIVIQK